MRATEEDTLAAEPARRFVEDEQSEVHERLATSHDTPVAGHARREPGAIQDANQETTERNAEALTVARRVVDLAADKLASDILLLDIRGVSLIADYFVICTAGSERQSTAIVKDLDDKIREEFGRKPLNRDVRGEAGWVLLDYGDVLVHIFSPEQRSFYQLEQLWSSATQVVRLQ